jgi:hypothetical protein
MYAFYASKLKERGLDRTDRKVIMGDIINEAHGLVQCKSCPWYKNCVLPIRVTEEDLRRQVESSMPDASFTGADQGITEFLSGMATAAQNSLLEGCPVFIDRLRKEPKLAQRIKKMMQEWAQEDAE